MRLHPLAIAAPFVLSLAAVPAAAGTVVHAFLWDSGADTVMTTGLGAGEGGDKLTATMGIAVSATEIPAGEVTFEVTNVSKAMVHEMLVVPLAAGEVKPPYDVAEQEVNEDEANSQGEVSETDPGGTGSLTVTLKPGRYMLVCNLPGHYEAGMWTYLTVK